MTKAQKVFLWIIMSMLLMFSTYSIAGVTFTIIALITVSCVVLGSIVIDDACRLRILKSEKWVLALIVLSAISVTVNANFRYDRVMLLLCTFLLAVYIKRICQHQKDLEYVLFIFVTITTLSSFVLICQYLGMGWAKTLREYVVPNPLNDISDFEFSNRYAGLSPSILTYAYQCSMCLGVLIAGKWKELKAPKIILYFIFGLNAIGLILNRTRSAEIAVVLVGILKVWGIIKRTGRTKKLIILFVLLIAVMVALAVLESGVQLPQWAYYITRSEENSFTGTTARVPMVLTAFNHALKHPLGLGTYDVREEALIVGATTERMREYVINNTAHNILGNIAACYGFLGVALYIAWLISCYKSYRELKKGKICILGESLGDYPKMCAAGVLTATINSMFHNAGIINGELCIWISYGLLLGCTKIYKSSTDCILNEWKL